MGFPFHPLFQISNILQRSYSDVPSVFLPLFGTSLTSYPAVGYRVPPNFMFNLCRINTSCKFYTFFSSFYLFLSPPPSFSLSLFLSLFRPTPQPLPCIFICFYCSSIPMLMTFLTHNFFVLVQGAHRKALDVLNTVGLSNSVLKLIERRNRVDKWIKYTGMVVSVVVLYTFWRWAH